MVWDTAGQGRAWTQSCSHSSYPGPGVPRLPPRAEPGLGCRTVAATYWVLVNDSPHLVKNQFMGVGAPSPGPLRRTGGGTAY